MCILDTRIAGGGGDGHRVVTGRGGVPGRGPGLAGGQQAAATSAVGFAKAYANEAAGVAARVALQCHGAIGYTFEHDLHLWLKRVWSLQLAWGDTRYHRHQVATAVLG